MSILSDNMRMLKRLLNTLADIMVLLTNYSQPKVDNFGKSIIARILLEMVLATSDLHSQRMIDIES